MWTSDIPSIVLTKVKHLFSEKIKDKYPDLNFTTKSKTGALTSFPTVYINKLSSPEMGQTLDGTEINAIMANFYLLLLVFFDYFSNEMCFSTNIETGRKRIGHDL